MKSFAGIFMLALLFSRIFWYNAAMKTHEPGIFRKADIALIAVLLVFSGAFLFLSGGTGASGGVGTAVRISVDGAVRESVPLAEDGEIRILNAAGKHTNTLRIEDGKVSMIDADCPDGFCLSYRPVRLRGEMIVCLPNRVVVEIEGGEAAYDALVH